jgi:hypothetical protein
VQYGKTLYSSQIEKKKIFFVCFGFLSICGAELFPAHFCLCVKIHVTLERNMI